MLATAYITTAHIDPNRALTSEEAADVRMCLEALGFAECRQVPPRGDECLLNSVLGAPDVTQDPMRDDEQRVSAAASDGGEGLLVPGPRRLDECEVHSSGSLIASLVGTLHPL